MLQNCGFVLLLILFENLWSEVLAERHAINLTNIADLRKDNIMSSSPLAVAVVGAGAAGLCAARHLASNPQVFLSDPGLLVRSMGRVVTN